MSASNRTRTAVSLPSASAASSMSWIWPRPWMVATAFSVRSSFQRTGSAVLAGQRDAEQLLGVHVELRAEAATDRRRHDPHLVLGDAEGDGHHDLEDVRDLRRRVQRDLAAERLRDGGHGPGLHGHRDEALLDVALLHRVGRGGEGLLDGIRRGRCRAPRCRSCSCRARRGRAPGRSTRVLEVDHGLERLVVDWMASTASRASAFARGHDHGHAVADVARLVAGDAGSAAGSSCPR